MQDRASLLIVDDERGPMESLRMIFKPTYRVFTASGGPQALEVLRAHPIDVVTLDLKMPGMSGIEVMEKIKQHDPDIEVIIVTGYSSLDTAIRGLRFRAFDYISKPFDVAEISDIVQRAVQQRRATLRLRQRRENFLANLSHELRTPLSAIIGYSTILFEELQRRVSPEQRFALERIQANSHELLGLVEDVLLLSSLEYGELPVERGEFDLCEVVRRVAARYEGAAARKGLQIQSCFPSGPVYIVSDELKLERALWALMDNAVKFTAAGGVRLLASEGATEDSVEIQVVDTGIGMNEEEVQQAMEGFFQVDSSTTRCFRGLGLGFRMAVRLVRFLGGDLTVHTAPGAGTRVTIRLPRRLAAAQASAAHA